MADDRRSPRRVANTVHTFQLEPKNDAVVLNFSDAGLGFRARNPLMTQRGPIRFSFSENGQQFEAIGELAWTDSTRKTGGLCLDSLPQVDRERIQNWINQGITPGKAPTVSVRAAPAPREFPLPAADQTEANVPANARTHSQANRSTRSRMPNPRSDPVPALLSRTLLRRSPRQPGFMLFGGLSSAQSLHLGSGNAGCVSPAHEVYQRIFDWCVSRCTHCGDFPVFLSSVIRPNSFAESVRKKGSAGVASSPAHAALRFHLLQLPMHQFHQQRSRLRLFRQNYRNPSTAQTPPVSGPPPVFGGDSKLSSGPPNIATGTAIARQPYRSRSRRLSTKHWRSR